MYVFDQHHDPSYRVLHRLRKEFPDAMEFAKTAQVAPEGAEALPDTAFAWPEEQRFPIHSKEHTVLSLLYRTKCAAVPAHVDEALEKAKTIYVLKDLPMVKQAAAPVDDSGDFLVPAIKRFRVKTASDVLPAAYAMQRHYRKMDIPTRVTACRRLLKVANAHNIELPPSLLKMAGVTLSSAPLLLDFLEMRKEAAAQTQHPQAVREGYRKLAALVASLPPDEFHNPEVLAKLAGAITRMDERTGLADLWDTKLPDPVQSVYNTEKTASPTLNVAGRQVPLGQMMDIDKAAYADAFGADFVNDVFKGAQADPERLIEAMPTMPKDLQGAFFTNVFGLRR